MKIGLEFFEIDGTDYLIVTNPAPRWRWLPAWVLNLFRLTETHVTEAD